MRSETAETTTAHRGRKAPEGGNMRQELEKRLYDLRFDMDCIDLEEDLRNEIRNLTDEELVNLIAEYEEEED